MEKKITEEMLAWLFAGKVILNLVREGAVIDEEIHLKVFALDNAAEILLEYAKHGHELSDKAQLKVFALPDEKAAEILREYVEHRMLCPKDQKRYDELIAKSAKG